MRCIHASRVKPTSNRYATGWRPTGAGSLISGSRAIGRGSFVRAFTARGQSASHSAMSASVVSMARSRTWISFMPSHQCFPPISAVTGRPARA
jgi:hypothetical protein